MEAYVGREYLAVFFFNEKINIFRSHSKFVLKFQNDVHVKGEHH